MVSILSLLTNILLYSAVLTASSSRLEARQSLSHNRVVKRPICTSCDESNVEATVNTTNWAGAVWLQNSGTFTSVTGTFKVPTASSPINSGAAIWVGIDGLTEPCKDIVLQAGVTINVDNDGVASYYAWYEWLPADSVRLDIVINSGDFIRATVISFNTTSGLAIIENLTSNKTIESPVSAPSVLHPLCGKTAEWIVEDYTVVDATGTKSYITFADLGNVTFKDAFAFGPHGSDETEEYTPCGASVVNMVTQSIDVQPEANAFICGSQVTIVHA